VLWRQTKVLERKRRSDHDEMSIFSGLDKGERRPIVTFVGKLTASEGRWKNGRRPKMVVSLTRTDPSIPVETRGWSTGSKLDIPLQIRPGQAAVKQQKMTDRHFPVLVTDGTAETVALVRTER
jgi:hypothetical protein